MQLDHEHARLAELRAMLVAYEQLMPEDPDEDLSDWQEEVRDEVWRLETEIRDTSRQLRRAA